MEKLLDAEFDAVKGRTGVTQSNYEAAITLAARKGLVSEQAIINERYGDFMFESLINYNDACKCRVFILCGCTMTCHSQPFSPPLTSSLSI